MEKQRAPAVEVKEKEPTTEMVFRNITIVLVCFLVYCIPGFLSFREVAIEQGFHFVRSDSWLWCVVGFVAYGTVKYTYFSMIKEGVLAILHPKFKGDQRLYRLKAVSKLSFDTIFYSVASLVTYMLFRKESWFPQMMGGEGECSSIYKQFPNWPSQQVSNKIEIFYMVQLGIHFFSIFEIITIRRKTDRKYYQFLLHHFVATSLILFSLLTNNVAVGTIILFLHNFSDITAAFVRGLVETKYNNFVLDAIFWLMAVINWSYMRVVVFPFCAIRSVYENIPSHSDPWSSIRIPQMFLILLLSILVCMHVFWLFFLVKTGVDMALGKGISNAHDKQKVKK